MAQSSHGMKWVIGTTRPAQHLTLTCIGPHHELINSIELALPDDPSELAEPVPLHARREGVYVGLGRRLISLEPNERTVSIEMPLPIRTLAGSAPFTRARVVATFEQGAAMYWADGSGRLRQFAEELSNPIAVFTRGGRLVLAESGRLDIYGSQERRIVLEASMATPHSTPISLLAINQRDQFALLTADGPLRVYEVR